MVFAITLIRRPYIRRHIDGTLRYSTQTNILTNDRTAFEPVIIRGAAGIRPPKSSVYFVYGRVYTNTIGIVWIVPLNGRIGRGYHILAAGSRIVGGQLHHGIYFPSQKIERNKEHGFAEQVLIRYTQE